MAEKNNDYYNRLIDKILSKLLNAFGSHLISVSSFFQSESGFKPVLLVHLDEPFVRLFNRPDVYADQRTISKVLKGKIEIPIYLITSNEISALAQNFPIELVHIKNRYRKCYGDDPIGQMNVNFDNLHNAVTASMQGVLMRLRIAYISQNYDDLFIMEIINRLYSVFEALLFLRSQSIPFTLSELAFKIESNYSIKNSALSEIAKSMGNKNIKGIAKNTLKLLTTLEEILAEIKGTTEN
ncbi:MAG: hypothetical protein LBH98_04835 [Chitinispirillales bacterium]|nr:hypothetical protein [Chitinispirillales bacterium]